MFTHNIELRIWDTKEKVGAKARFTKPKQFKIPSSKPGKAYPQVLLVYCKVCTTYKLCENNVNRLEDG